MEGLKNKTIWDDGATEITIIVGLSKKRILESDELKWNKEDGQDGRRYLTLGEIANQINEIELGNFRKRGFDERTLTGYRPFITIIEEIGLSGRIYQYGNYGPEWVLHGTTKGYA